MMRGAAITVLLAACASSPVAEPTVAPTVTPPAKRSDDTLGEGDDPDVIKPKPHEVMVGSRAVYLVEACWDPGQFTVAEIRVGKKVRPCMQSHVILGIQTPGAGQLVIREARVLDAATRERVGSVRLRVPKQRIEDAGFVGRMGFVEGKRDWVRFDMGEPDFAGRSGAAFNSEGPFVLELAVVLDEVHVVVRSPEFVNYDADAPGAVPWTRAR